MYKGRQLFLFVCHIICYNKQNRFELAFDIFFQDILINVFFYYYLTTHSTHFIYSYMASDIW